MKPHKHAELIKAWADGAEIQLFDRGLKIWTDTVDNQPAFKEDIEYRIKPEPKPDVVKYFGISETGLMYEILPETARRHRFKLIWDGETGELKSAEVLK